MTENVIILRNAERPDAADLAILDDYASHGLASLLWQDAVRRNEAPTANLWGRSCMLDETGPVCYRNAVVALSDDIIAGMALGYFIAEDHDEQAFETDQEILKPLMTLFKLARGSWLIDGLAVYPEYAGSGIGTQLLQDQFKRARHHSRRVTLVAEDSNHRALNLYKKHGFEPGISQRAKAYGARENSFEYCLMTKTLEISTS